MPQDNQEIISPEQTAAFSKQIADVIGTSQSNISVKNSELFLAGSNRFAYGFRTEPQPDNGQSVPVGFIKVCRPENQPQLAREALVAILAPQLDLPAIPCLTPLTEVGGNFLIELAALNIENGDLLSNRELLVAADSSLGTKATEAILLLCQKEIPANIDTSVLKRDDDRSHSPETFARVWQEQNDIVFNPQHHNLVETLVGVEELKKTVASISADLQPLLQQSENSDAEYLVHDDASPNNMFFNKDGSVIILDWEHVGATHNYLLAQLTDLGNFYGRCWPNPEMQQAVLSTILHSNKFESVVDRYKIAKAVAVFGSMYLAKYAMDPTHSEHQMSVSLLGNLQKNLDQLDAEYRLLNET